MPPTFGSGATPRARPIAPTIYLTDITGQPETATGGDWEHGGHGRHDRPPTSRSPLRLVVADLGTKPVNKNDWDLGPNADPIPATDAFGGDDLVQRGLRLRGGRGTSRASLAYDPTTNTFGRSTAGPHVPRAEHHPRHRPEQLGGGDVGEVCTTFSIPKVQPTISTTQDPASGAVGATYKDKATLSKRSNLDGTGSITWTLYPNNNCTGTPLGTDTETAISANSPHETPNGVTVNKAGTYYWVAHFSGDNNNNSSADSGCAAEPITVNPADIKILKKADASSRECG